MSFTDPEYDRQTETKNPDTGKPECRFRERVREALDFGWDARDAVILAELKRLKATDFKLAAKLVQ